MLNVCVQAGTTEINDPTIDQYHAVQLIADWPKRVDETLDQLDLVGKRVMMWRFTQDPRVDPRWPGYHVIVCPNAQFANEPDIEGPLPNWYGEVTRLWKQAHGFLISVPYSDQSKYEPIGITPDIWACHCYAGKFLNYEIAQAQARGRPVWITEYAHQWAQEDIEIELEPYLDAFVPVFAFIWQWLPPGNQPGFDLRGVTLQRPKVGLRQGALA